MLKKIFSNTLIKNGAYYTLGTFILQGINFLTLPLYTRILTTRDFGITSLYSAWQAVVIIFLCLQTFSTIQNAKVTYDEEEYREYNSNIVVLSFVSFAFFAVLIMFFAKPLSVFSGLSTQLIFLMLLHSFFTLGITFKTTILRFDGLAERQLFISMFYTVLNIGLSFFFITSVSFVEKATGKILGAVVPSVILGGYYYLEIIRKKKPTFKREHFIFCLTLGLPLIVHSLSHIVLTSSDRMMIEKFIGLEETGIYGFTYTIGTILSTAAGAFGSAWVPWYFKNLKENNHSEIKIYSRNYLDFFTLVTVGFIFISPEIVRFMGSADYQNGRFFLPWIIFGCYFIFLYSFPVNYEFYVKKTNYIALGTSLSALINLGLNYIFIPKYSSFGASVTTLVSYFFLFLFHETIARKKLNYRLFSNIQYFLRIGIVFLSCFAYTKIVDIIWVRYGIILTLGVIFLAGVFKILKNKKQVWLWVIWLWAVKR